MDAWNGKSKSGPKGGFLCDEMGLGKSVQLICTMLGNPTPRTLIIVPKSIITQWVEEINRFAPNLTINIFDGPERKMKEADITIAPYTLLTVKGAEVVHPHLSTTCSGIALFWTKATRFETSLRNCSKVCAV